MRVTIIWALLVTSCAANPSVQYKEAVDGTSFQSAAPDLIDSFYLQKNSISIELKNTAAADKPPVYEFGVSDTRLEDQTHRLMMLRADQPWTRTTVNLTKVENTDLIQTAGVEVLDRRSELIQNVAGIAKAIVPLVFAAGALPPIPKCGTFPAQACEIVPISDLPIGEGQGEAANGKGLHVSWGPRSKSAVPIDYFLTSLAARRVNGLYYASCRDFEVNYLRHDAPLPANQGFQYSWRGKIADPRWVEFVAFPRKGNVRMHAQCGVSTTTEKDPTEPLDTVISNAVTQAIAVKEAIDKAQKQDKKQ